MLKVSSSLPDQQYLNSFLFVNSFFQSMIFLKLKNRVFMGKIMRHKINKEQPVSIKQCGGYFFSDKKENKKVCDKKLGKHFIRCRKKLFVKL